MNKTKIAFFLFLLLIISTSIVVAYETPSRTILIHSVVQQGSESLWSENQTTNLTTLTNNSMDLFIDGNINSTGQICDTNGCIGSGSINYWNKTGTDLYYTQGFVGAGISTPEYALDVSGQGNSGKINARVGLNFQGTNQPPSFTSTLIESDGNLGVGQYYYYITYYTAIGETKRQNSASCARITTDATHKQILLELPVSNDKRVIGRKIYRTKANNAFYMGQLVASIPNNIDTSYIDNIADINLGNSAIVYWQDDTTNKLITYNGNKLMVATDKNTVYGVNAFNSATRDQYATIIGTYAGYRLAGSTGTSLIGYRAGFNLRNGNGVTAVGYIALYEGTSSQASTAIGTASMATGNHEYSVAVGSEALRSRDSTTAKKYNTGLGYKAGYWVNGDGNTDLGYKAGFYDEGDYNIKIGYNMLGATGDSYKLKIGLENISIISGDMDTNKLGFGGIENPINTVDINGETVIGRSYSGTNTAPTDGLLVEGNVGIGTTTPSEKLEIAGNIKITQEIEIDDLNTGLNVGSSICVDINNKLCKCGSCA